MVAAWGYASRRVKVVCPKNRRSKRSVANQDGLCQGRTRTYTAPGSGSGAGDLASDGAPDVDYLIAPTVNPAMKRSTKKLYRMAMGTLAMKQPAMSDPQKYTSP